MEVRKLCDLLAAVISILLYIFEGYCIQYLFCAFAKPRISNIKQSEYAVGIVWVIIRLISFLFPSDGTFTALKLLIYTFILLLFCLLWYRGNVLMKVFLVVQFMALRELAFFTAYSFTHIYDFIIDILSDFAYKEIISADVYLILIKVMIFLSLITVQIIQSGILLFALKKIVRYYRCQNTHSLNKEVLFYLLPSVAGLLIAVLIRIIIITVENGSQILLYNKYPSLYFIVPVTALVLLISTIFSFKLYQDMTELQMKQADKVILENQIIQMQNSMTEMEHLYDGIRSVKHDMKNNMEVLQNLLKRKYLSDGSEDNEIKHYFDGMYTSVEQLDNRIHTGSAVSDAVINSKFRYAEKEITNIMLNADDFVMPDNINIQAYDIGIILNNGLDNAIEACKKMHIEYPASKTFISVRSFCKRNMFFIEVENSFDGFLKIDKDSGYPVSTKEESKSHGIGLRNIKNCAKKYAGDIDCIVEDKKFILSVMLKG